jgi:NAD(P)-dependent dehydrogenase (short-subunit alcohol dehydrogenase family)
MNSFPDGFRALILGASGGIGQAFVQALQADPRCAQVVGLHRQSSPALDLDDEASIGAAAEQPCTPPGKFHLIINAAGLLHTADFHAREKTG